MRRWINRCLALCAADILALVWAGLPAAAAAPTLTVDPSSGPCPVLHQTRVTLRGSGFTPGVVTRFVLRRDRDGAITAANSQAGGRPAEADGTYVNTLQLVGCGPDEPVGSTFTITVFEYWPGRAPTQGPGASATFTVTAPSPAAPGLPNTGGGGTAAPTLVLDPSQGPCPVDNPLITLRGTGFPPGMTLRRITFRRRDQSATGFDSMAGQGIKVGADGTFTDSWRVHGCGPDEPEGSQFVISVFEHTGTRGGTPTVQASATFTVSPTVGSPRAMPSTGGGGSADEGTAPILTLEPDQAPCDARNLPVIVRGQGFLPGQVVGFFSGPLRGRGGAAFAGLPIPADGAFAFEVNMRLLGIACGISGVPLEPDGTQYRVFAYVDTGRGGGTSGAVLATTLFTVSSSATLPQASPDTYPALTLTPARGSCLDRIVARGARFPAGRAVTLTAVQTGPGSGRSSAYRVIARPTAAPDGTLAVEFALPPVAPHGCGQCGVNGCGADPTGEEYTITAIPDRAPGDPVTPPARATFAVTSPAMLPSALPRVGAGGQGRALPSWGPGAGLAALTGLCGMYARRRSGQAPRHGPIDAS